MRRDPFEGLRRSKRRAFVFLLRRLVRIVYGDGSEPDVIFAVCVGEALLHCLQCGRRFAGELFQQVNRPLFAELFAVRPACLGDAVAEHQQAIARASCTREFWSFQLGKTPRTAPPFSSSCTEPEARLRIGGGWPAQVYCTVFLLHRALRRTALQTSPGEAFEEFRER
jgi:hypothetical protein